MLGLFLFVGLSLFLAFAVGLIAGYAGLCHWLLDKLAVMRERRAILDAARRDREAGGR